MREFKLVMYIIGLILNLYLFVINYNYFADYASLEFPKENMALSLYVGNTIVWFIFISAQIFIFSLLMELITKLYTKDLKQ